MLDARLEQFAFWEAEGDTEALVLVLLDPAEAPPARRAAAQALARLEGPVELLRRLGEGWWEEPPEQRALLVELLASLGDFRLSTLLVAAAHDPERLVRLAALRGLTALADGSVARDVAPLVEHPDPQTRSLVARLLARVGGVVGARGCVRLLNDPVWAVRRDVCAALRDHPLPGLLLPLVGRLEDLSEPSEVRFKAVEALAATGERAAVGPLLRALEDPDPQVSSSAAYHLGDLRDVSALEPLVRYLRARHDAEYAHAGAAVSLGLLGDPRAVPALVEALADDRAAVRGWAAQALGRLEQPAAVEALLRALEDGHAEVRAQASWALGRLGDRRAVGPLLARLAEPEPRVRALAAAALGALGDPLAAEGLVLACAPAQKEEVRTQATLALGLVGRGSRTAAAHLLELLDDPVLSVRRAAAQALRGVEVPGLIPALRARMRPESALVQDRTCWLDLLAARALLGDHACHEALRRLLTREGEVATEAGLRLARLGDARGLAACIEASQSPRLDRRLQAVAALGALGDPRGMAALRARARDRHPEVQEAARRVILQLEAP